MLGTSKSKTTSEMLGEICQETAAQLISSVLYQTSPPGSLGSPTLDSLFLRAAPAHAPPNSSLNRGDVVEIQGPAASGKTWLIHIMMMSCVLPYETPGATANDPKIMLGGWNRAAIICDTQGNWSASRLADMLHVRLRDARVDEDSIELLITNALRRVHVFRPDSSASLAATLYRLPNYHATRMADEEIGLIAIDSISSFYWVDRYMAEQQRNIAGGPRESVSSLSHVLYALQEIRLSQGPVIAFTNWALATHTPAPSTDTSEVLEPPRNGPLFRQHLFPFPAPFEHPPRQTPNAHLMPPITHHITLEPSKVDEEDISNSRDNLATNGNGRQMISGFLRSGKSVEASFNVAVDGRRPAKF